MKILYYCLANHDAEVAARVHVIAICRELARLGHKVTLLTWCSRSLTRSDFEIIAVPHVQAGRVGQLISGLAWRLWAVAAMILLRPQVIYEREASTSGTSRVLSCIGKSIRVVELNGWRPHDSQDGDSGSRAAYKALLSLSRNLRSAAAIITSSPGVRALAIEQCNLSPDKVHYVPNGVDVEVFAPQGGKQVENHGEFVVGYVGSLHPGQDVRTLLQATRTLAEDGIPVELRLVGSGATLEHWQQLASSMGLQERVHFLGERPHSEIASVLWGAHVCVAAYSRSHIMQCDGVEAAMKLWEYWASRRPVIVTDYPGTQSYHHHTESRFLAVEPESPQQLALALRHLYRNPELRRALATNGFDYVVDHRSWRHTATEIANILLDCIALTLAST